MSKLTEVTPAGCEAMNSQRELAARMLCSVAEAGRRIAFGHIKPAVCTARSQFYRSEDLNEHRAQAIAKIAKRCSQLNVSERARIVQLFAEISAAEHQRPIPGVEDMAAGARGADVAAEAGPDSWLKQLVRPH